MEAGKGYVSRQGTAVEGPDGLRPRLHPGQLTIEPRELFLAFLRRNYARVPGLGIYGRICMPILRCPVL